MNIYSNKNYIKICENLLLYTNIYILKDISIHICIFKNKLYKIIKYYIIV